MLNDVSTQYSTHPLPPPTMGNDKPRLFKVTYTQEKTANRISPALRAQFLKPITLWGVVWPVQDSFPAQGISLSNGVLYVDMTELHESLTHSGSYHIEWMDK